MKLAIFVATAVASAFGTPKIASSYSFSGTLIPGGANTAPEAVEYSLFSGNPSAFYQTFTTSTVLQGMPMTLSLIDVCARNSSTLYTFVNASGSNPECSTAPSTCAITVGRVFDALRVTAPVGPCTIKANNGTWYNATGPTFNVSFCIGTAGRAPAAWYFMVRAQGVSNECVIDNWVNPAPGSAFGLPPECVLAPPAQSHTHSHAHRRTADAAGEHGTNSAVDRLTAMLDQLGM